MRTDRQNKSASSAEAGNGSGDQSAREQGPDAPPARRHRRRQRTLPDTSVPSPCVEVCRYNDENLCAGCLRTPDEIREWMIMSREQKLAVLALLEQRRHSAAR